MGVSISFARNTVADPVFTERLVSLTRDEAKVLVEALRSYEDRAGEYSAARLLMLDCSQFGWCGSEVRATVLATLLPTLAPELSAKIAQIVNETVTAGLTLTIDSGDDDWMKRGPHIAVCDEFEDEVSLHWTSGHAARAFEDLGYTSDADDWFCISVAASDLKAKAEQRLEIQPDSDTRALLAVATFALQKGGTEAAISAA